MKTVNQIETLKVAKTLKPRNHVLFALTSARGAGLQNSAGTHQKHAGAQRRAEKMATHKLAAELQERGQA